MPDRFEWLKKKNNLTLLSFEITVEDAANKFRPPFYWGHVNERVWYPNSDIVTRSIADPDRDPVLFDQL